MTAIDTTDCIPAASVEDLIQSVLAGVEELHGQVQQAIAAADQAERHQDVLLSGPDGVDDRMERLGATVAELGLAGREHLEAAITAAEAQATARLAAARAEAHDLIVRAHADRVAALAAVEIPGGVLPAAAAPLAGLPAGAPIPAPAPLAGWAPLPAPAAATPAAAPATPAAADDPTTVLAALSAAAAAPAPAEASAGEQEFVEFWEVADEASPSRARQLEGFTTALLPMIALVIVLVIALAWIG